MPIKFPLSGGKNSGKRSPPLTAIQGYSSKIAAYDMQKPQGRELFYATKLGAKLLVGGSDFYFANCTELDAC